MSESTTMFETPDDVNEYRFTLDGMIIRRKSRQVPSVTFRSEPTLDPTHYGGPCRWVVELPFAQLQPPMQRAWRALIRIPREPTAWLPVNIVAAGYFDNLGYVYRDFFVPYVLTQRRCMNCGHGMPAHMPTSGRCLYDTTTWVAPARYDYNEQSRWFCLSTQEFFHDRSP